MSVGLFGITSKPGRQEQQGCDRADAVAASARAKGLTMGEKTIEVLHSSKKGRCGLKCKRRVGTKRESRVEWWVLSIVRSKDGLKDSWSVQRR